MFWMREESIWKRQDSNPRKYKILGVVYSHFQRFLCKKALKKQEILSKFLQKTYFDQHLGCAAPKRWSKYTTSEYQSYA